MRAANMVPSLSGMSVCSITRTERGNSDLIKMVILSRFYPHFLHSSVQAASPRRPSYSLDLKRDGVLFKGSERGERNSNCCNSFTLNARPGDRLAASGVQPSRLPGYQKGHISTLAIGPASTIPTIPGLVND